MSDATQNLNLIVMRHAKSSWQDPSLDDFDRPLNERGRNAAVDMGKKLLREKVQVQVILASTAKRVRETLDLMLPAWSHEPEVLWIKRLYLAQPETILTEISAMPSDYNRVMIVGHNPGLSYLLNLLTHKCFDMPTAGVALLESNQSDWSQALRQRPWTLAQYWKPKELDD